MSRLTQRRLGGCELKLLIREPRHQRFPRGIQGTVQADVPVFQCINNPVSRGTNDVTTNLLIGIGPLSQVQYSFGITQSEEAWTIVFIENLDRGERLKPLFRCLSSVNTPRDSPLVGNRCIATQSRETSASLTRSATSASRTQVFLNQILGFFVEGILRNQT